MDSNNTSSTLTKNVIVNIAIVLPIIFTFYYVYNYGLTVPFWDQWDLVLLLEKMHNHSLTLGDLWAQHNEHRIIFPQIVMLFLARLSNWNIFLELCANMVIGVLILLFLLSILHNTIKPTSPFLKIVISMMVFSMVQRENWEWGWQITMFMSVLGSVIAIWAANKWQGKAIGLIIVISAAILSSYSFNSGLITWPAVLVVFLLQKKWKLKHIIILVSACIATVLLYYYKYTKPSGHPPVLFFMSHPLIYIEYVTTYLGESLVWNFPPGCLAVTIISLILISLAIFNVWRFDKQKLQGPAPWLGLGLYACMAACATGLGRAGLGWQQAASSRYTTISLFLPLCAIVLLRDSISFNPKKKNKALKSIIFIIIIFMFIVLYVTSYRDGVQEMKNLSANTNAAAFCLAKPQLANDYFLKSLNPDPNIVKVRIETLSELGIKFEIKPNYIEALDGIGVALQETGRVDEAVVYYKKAIEINPRFVDAYLNLASVLEIKGRFAEAVEQYRTALTIKASPDIHNSLGKALINLDMFQQAAAEYRIALSAIPDNPNLLNNLGYALASSGEYNEAISLYNKALQIEPDFIDARINLGFALANSGNLPQAALEYEKILLAHPGNAVVHNDLGIVLAMQGKIDAAIAHFRQAVQINPQYSDAKNNLNAALTIKQTKTNP